MQSLSHGARFGARVGLTLCLRSVGSLQPEGQGSIELPAQAAAAVRGKGMRSARALLCRQNLACHQCWSAVVLCHVLTSRSLAVVEAVRAHLGCCGSCLLVLRTGPAQAALPLRKVLSLQVLALGRVGSH